MANTKTTNAKKQEPAYSKAALLNSKMFSVIERDILNITLEDDKSYTMNEVQDEIKKFKEGI